MLRAIIKRKWKDSANGATGEQIMTLDFVCEALQSELSRGGLSEDGYEIFELVGVEVNPETECLGKTA